MLVPGLVDPDLNTTLASGHFELTFVIEASSAPATIAATVAAMGSALVAAAEADAADILSSQVRSASVLV